MDYKLSSISFSLNDEPVSPETIETALFCTFLIVSLSPTPQVHQAGTENSRFGLTLFIKIDKCVP